MLKSVSIAALAFVFVAGLSGPVQAATYKIKWLLGHTNLDYFEQAAAEFKTSIEAGSNGDIAVEIVKAEKEALAAQSSAEIAASVAKGDAQMGHSFTDVMGAVDKRFMVFKAPYLFRDYRHMEGFIEGPLGEGLLEGLRDHKMVGLSLAYCGGANGVAALDREIRKPEDLKGLKVGVYGDAVNNAWLTSLGATPVPIKHQRSGILGWARDGSLDAVVITWRNLEQAALHQGFKYFSMPGSTYLVSVTYVNEKFYESLPPAYRELIKKASQEAGRIERARTIELNEDAKRIMLAKGVRPVHMTEAGRQAFARAFAPVYKGEISDLLGKDFIEKIRATPGVPVHTIPKGVASR